MEHTGEDLWLDMHTNITSRTAPATDDDIMYEYKPLKWDGQRQLPSGNQSVRACSADEKSPLEEIPEQKLRSLEQEHAENPGAAYDPKLYLTKCDQMKLSSGYYGCPCAKGRIFSASEEAVHRIVLLLCMILSKRIYCIKQFPNIYR